MKLRRIVVVAAEISIHVPSVEDDLPTPARSTFARYFNPRPPCGGRPVKLGILASHADFNPRPPCGGRHFPISDKCCYYAFQSTSPVWRTTPKPAGVYRGGVFQSTSPVWRTTLGGGRLQGGRGYFNPRPPCGGRRWDDNGTDWYDNISIHVPRVEDDRTRRIRHRRRECISIHVPRVEDDQGS